MSTSTIHLPRVADGFTVEDWITLRTADTEHHYELSAGRLIVMNSAASGHANIVMRLVAWFLRHGYDPDVLMADMALVTGVADGREPDLMVLHKPIPNTLKLYPEQVRLVVEVESPSSVHDDRVIKPAEYAAAGISHYWRIIGANDPDTAEIDCHVLRGGEYVRYWFNSLAALMAFAPDFHDGQA